MTTKHAMLVRKAVKAFRNQCQSRGEPLGLQAVLQLAQEPPAAAISVALNEYASAACGQSFYLKGRGREQSWQGRFDGVVVIDGSYKLRFITDAGSVALDPRDIRESAPLETGR